MDILLKGPYSIMPSLNFQEAMNSELLRIKIDWVSSEILLSIFLKVFVSWGWKAVNRLRCYNYVIIQTKI